MTETKKGIFPEIGGLLKHNIREYMMYIVLVAIIILSAILTDGKFISANNIFNLFNQAAYVAVLAIGMTVILILKKIDLSVGYVAGFCGAVAALLLREGLSVFIVIPVVILIGVGIGTYQGLLVTRIRVPAFVTTLAGMFLFRGLLGMITSKTGTIVVKDEVFIALNNGSIPSIATLYVTTPEGVEYHFHLLTMAIGIAAVVFLIHSRIKDRKNKLIYNFNVVSTPIFVTSLVIASIVIMTIITIFAMENGIPWSAVIVCVILFIYNFILNKTRLGRYVYGIGGNDQAAELSGVNVKNVTLIAFISMGALAAIAGILYTSRLSSATPQAGTAFEMDAIASSYIGGVAVSGGVGKVTNTIIGALVIMSLTNVMNLLGTDIFLQYVVKGIIFILAVAFDVVSRKRSR